MPENDASLPTLKELTDVIATAAEEVKRVYAWDPEYVASKVLDLLKSKTSGSNH